MPYLKLLGGAVVEDDAGVVAGVASRHHPLALLALIATAPSRSMSRGKLVGHLWPEAPEKTARNRLGTVVHRVRSKLGEEVLISVGDDLRLERDALSCDVWCFQDAVDAADHERAVELYGGPFLDGFELGGSPGFEEHVKRERDRLRRAHCAALEALAGAAERRDEPETAAEWWRERLLENPYDTRVARRLMEALAAADNRAEALRVAREHERILEKEFATVPGAEFRATVEMLRGEGGESPDGGELPVRSVAVLPFEDLSGSANAAVFAEGLHDDLITELSRLPALTVISRTSVVRYRGGDRSVPEIARELGVGTVVEAAVQSARDRIRLNVQLIDARTDAHRWVEQYDRDLTPESLFEVQGELAGKIAGTLRAEIAPGERRGIGREPPGELEAYRLYVQGRGLIDQRTEDEVRRSLDYFQRVIERDPGYALAWSGLADALSLLEFYDYPAPASSPGPMESARRAVELGPDLGETHASLGIVLSIRHEGPAALQELEKAVELAPSYAEAHAWLAWVHLLRGSPERALGPARRGVELDPLAPAARAYLAEALLANDASGEALRETRRARESQPEYGLALFMEALVLYHRGRLADAASILEEILDLIPRQSTPTHTEVWAVLAVIRASSGDHAAARGWLGRIREEGDRFSTGLVHAALGEVDRAFEAFRSVPEWGSFEIEHLRYFFPDVLGPLRTDGRYRDLLRGVDRVWKGKRAVRRPGPQPPDPIA